MSSAGGYKKKKRTAEGRQGASTCGKSKPSTGRRALALQGRLCAQQLLEAKTCGTFSKRQTQRRKTQRRVRPGTPQKRQKLLHTISYQVVRFPPQIGGAAVMVTLSCRYVPAGINTGTISAATGTIYTAHCHTGSSHLRQTISQALYRPPATYGDSYYYGGP